MRKYLVFILGLCINSVGVSLITKAGLGTSPGSSIPYTLSLGLSPTMGQFTIAFNLLLVVLQIVLLKKEFEKIQYLQIVAAVIFGYLLDLWMLVLSQLTPKGIFEKLLVLLIGCVVLGLGVFTEVRANAIMLPGEGFVKAAAAKADKEFGVMKIVVDVSMVLIALLCSFILFRSIRGVGAGTVIAALITGLIANFFAKLLEPAMGKFLPGDTQGNLQPEKYVEAPSEHLEKQIILTIGREYGCGAREIGRLVAQKLGIAYYDRDIIDMTAEESGFTAEYILQHEERLSNSFLYDIYMQTYAYTNGEQSKVEAVRYAQEKVIKKITEKESCVLMGRAADYVLEEHEKAFHVFLYAPMDYKKQQVMKREGLSADEAERRITKIEQERRNHYRQYARREWGKANCYDLTVNTGLYGVEKTADIIVDMLKASNKAS